MGWVHRHKHRGAMLALIALALQVAVAFGHVHLHGLTGSAHAAFVKQVRLGHTTPAPAQNRGDDDDYCAVCASIFLTSSAYAPAPPQLLPPVISKRIEHSLRPAQLRGEPPRLAFRSRAPPVG
jgi:hypothetical protein